MKKTTSDRLNEFMNKYNLKQVDIINAAKPYTGEYDIKLNKNDLSQYVSGKVEPGQDKIFIMSKAMGVDPAWLMGLDVPMKKIININEKTKSTNAIPCLGSIAAGTPILAEQNIEDYFNLDSSIKADFALKVKGDSMIKANINNGDIVFIKKQCEVENGEIGAVLLDDEATLKRIYISNGILTLQAENDKYAPRTYTEGNIRILGKLVASLKLYN